MTVYQVVEESSILNSSGHVGFVDLGEAVRQQEYAHEHIDIGWRVADLREGR